MKIFYTKIVTIVQLCNILKKRWIVRFKQLDIIACNSIINMIKILDNIILDNAAAAAAAAAKSLQSFPILCDPIYGSPPGSSVSGILQARILEWVAISFSSAWK